MVGDSIQSAHRRTAYLPLGTAATESVDDRPNMAECVGRLRAVVARLRMETPHPAHRQNHFFEGAMPVSALLFSEPPLAKSPERRRPAPRTNLSH